MTKVNLLMVNWTDSQLNVLESNEKYLFIEAGAGSGKTAVLTEKILRIINSGIKSEEIIAITFTEKAAEELKQRLNSQLNNTSSHINASTFHGFCSEQIRMNAAILGVDPEFKILEESLSQYIFDKFINYHFKNRIKKNHLFVEFSEIYGPRDTVNWIKQSINRRELFKENLIFNRDSKSIHIKFEKWCALIEQIRTDWFEYKIQNNYLDFDDLLTYMHQYLKTNQHFKKQLIDQYRYIFIDEFQDTDPIQGKILLELAQSNHPPNLFIVGDWKQSIYAFRGAELKSIQKFKNDIINLGGQYMTLDDNFRSSQRIVNFFNDLFGTVFENNYQKQIAHKQLNVEYEWELINVPKVKTIPSKILQTKWLIHHIQNSNYQYKDIAILVRTNSDIRLIQDEFKIAGIPFIGDNYENFFKQKEITEIYYILKLLSDPEDQLALLGVLRNPLVSWDDDEIYLLFHQNLKEKNVLLWFTNHNQIQTKWESFLDKLNILIKQLDLLGVSEIMREIWEQFNYENLISCYENASFKYSQLMKLFSIIDSFEHNDDLNELILFFENQMKQNSKSENPVSFGTLIDAVTILTVHKSKGLEFPIVYLPFQQSIKSSHNLPWIYHPQQGGVFKSTEMDDSDTDLWKQIKNLIDEDNYLEELRLLYVACTRAQEKIIFISCNSKNEKKQDAFEKIISFYNIRSIDSLWNKINQNDEYQYLIENKSDKEPINKILSYDLLVNTNSEKNLEKHPLIISNELLLKSDRINFSVTSLARYMFCPSFYYLKEVCRLDPIQNHQQFEGKSNSNFGNDVHSFLENVPLQREWPYSVLEEDELREKYRSGPVLSRCRNLWNEPYFQSNILEHDQEFREVPFTLKFNKFIIEGKIDLVIIKNNMLSVYDYKTGALKDTVDEKNPYLLQLIIYAMACEKIFEQKIFQLGLIYCNESNTFQFWNWDQMDHHYWNLYINDLLKSIQIKSYGREVDEKICQECYMFSLCNRSTILHPLTQLKK